ncbi:MAG: DUF2461 domain-containing protein [Ignavibacteriaceae bacterium]
MNFILINFGVVVAASSLINFPGRTISFLKKLSKNNNREWFEKNRNFYNKDFLEPAQEFVIKMGEKLSKIAPEIIAIPKIDKSIFRIFRDVRFSKDKSPYKTNFGAYFWEGEKKMESSGFYFHVDPKEFFIGVGIYMFPKDLLKKYREAASDPVTGKELNNILKSILKNKNYSLGGKNYKKTPTGYDPDNPNADLLLHDGVYIFYGSKNLNELKNKPVDFTFKIFKDMLPLHKWFIKNLS